MWSALQDPSNTSNRCKYLICNLYFLKYFYQVLLDTRLCEFLGIGLAGQVVGLECWDTPAHHDYDKVKELLYHGTDVVIWAVDLSNSISFQARLQGSDRNKNKRVNKNFHIVHRD